MAKSQKQAAIEAINKKGCLLVFSLKDRKEPESLWSVLYPRSKMRWEWDTSGDDRVFRLWSLREELSRSKKVVYTKWYQGRATFFSREVFVMMLAYLRSAFVEETQLSFSSREALDSLLLDSPQSTKILKAGLEWQGKMMESHYNRAMKPLWNYLLIVGFGEVDDSSFPSLNIAATKHLYEDLWLESLQWTPDKAEAALVKILGEKSSFLKQARKLASQIKETEL